MTKPPATSFLDSSSSSYLCQLQQPLLSVEYWRRYGVNLQSELTSVRAQLQSAASAANAEACVHAQQYARALETEIAAAAAAAVRAGSQGAGTPSAATPRQGSAGAIAPLQLRADDPDDWELLLERAPASFLSFAPFRPRAPAQVPAGNAHAPAAVAPANAELLQRVGTAAPRFDQATTNATLSHTAQPDPVAAQSQNSHSTNQQAAVGHGFAHESASGSAETPRLAAGAVAAHGLGASAPEAAALPARAVASELAHRGVRAAARPGLATVAAIASQTAQPQSATAQTQNAGSTPHQAALGTAVAPESASRAAETASWAAGALGARGHHATAPEATIFPWRSPMHLYPGELA